MSQHSYSYRYSDITVLAGWDRPLGYLFLTVQNDTSDIPIYCNLDDPKAESPQDTLHYQKILRALSIPIPDGFWYAIENDRSENKGNSLTKWELS